MPTIPAVPPASSIPCSPAQSRSPDRTRAWTGTTLLATAIISATACSATAAPVYPAVLHTATPRSRQYSRSTYSTAVVVATTSSSSGSSRRFSAPRSV